MENFPDDGVVVGTDGSEQSRVAVDWAARAAALRERPLWIVHAFLWPLFRVPLGPSPLGPVEGGLRQAAERVLAEDMHRVRQLVPSVEVHSELIVGAPAAALLGVARGAALLVVGSRGLGGFTGLLVGSVSAQLASHAPCPLVVVRGHHAPEGISGGQVVVGLDGSADAQAALAFGFEEASWRRLGLTVVHAWTGKGSGAAGDHPPSATAGKEIATREEVAARTLAEALAGWQEKFPDVVIHRRMVRGVPATVLLKYAAGAELLVLGSRGRGGFRGLLLGSVSQAVLHHADCPVAILRSGEDRGPGEADLISGDHPQ